MFLRLIKNKYFWAAFLIIVLTLSIANMTSSGRPGITRLEKLIRDIYTPLQGGVNEFRLNWNGVGSVFSDKKTLNNKIVQLEKENERLKLENQSLREYKAEVNRIRNLMNFADKSVEMYDMVGARVIARSPSNWYKGIMIDKGFKDGIRDGMPVINPSGLVGRVVNVSDYSAQVSLLTDRETAVGVIVQQSRETNGIVEGQGVSNQLRMVNIPYYSKIEVRNKIVTSGLSQIYPKGIDIGVVESVKREKNGLLLSANIKPVVDFDRLEEVLVITDYHPVEVKDAEQVEE